MSPKSWQLYVLAPSLRATELTENARAAIGATRGARRAATDTRVEAVTGRAKQTARRAFVRPRNWRRADMASSFWAGWEEDVRFLPSAAAGANCARA